MPGLFGSLFGGGGSHQQQYIPYNAGGTGQGGTVYTPTNQPGFDQQYQQLVNNLTGQAFDVGGGGPAEFSPFASSAAVNIADNPYAQGQLGGAISTGQYLSGLGQGVEAQAGEFAGIPHLIEGLASQASGGVGPTQQLAGDVANYLGPVQGLASGVASLAPGVTTGIAPLQQGASQVLQTGFDPRSALFNQLRQQSLDTSSATNAMAGLGSSPYGAELTTEALNNLGIDWQNQQLARQAQGLGAAGEGYGRAGALAGTAGGLLEGAGGLYGQGGRLAGEAGNLFGSAAQQAGQTANLYGNVMPAVSQNLQLGGAGADAVLRGTGLPYSTSVQQSQTALPAVQSAANLGLQRALLPQQVAQDIQSYLGLGQSASEISAALGNIGFNQGQTQFGNIGSALGGLGSLAGGFTGSDLTGLGGLGAGLRSGYDSLFGGGAMDFSGGAAGIGGDLAGTAAFSAPIDAYGGLSLADLAGLGVV